VIHIGFHQYYLVVEKSCPTLIHLQMLVCLVSYYSMIGQNLIRAFVITPSTSLPLEPQPPNGSFLFVSSPMKHILNEFLSWVSSQYSSPKHFSNNLHFEISYSVVKVLNNGCFYVEPSMLLPWTSNNCADFSFPQYTHAPLFNVAINKEGWIKICTPHLVYSQIWLNHLGLIAIFPASTYGWS
jgi:hypothetical protein